MILFSSTILKNMKHRQRTKFLHGRNDMTAIGAILLILGASAMDSESLVLPAALVVTGILLIGLGRRSAWITEER